MNRTCKTCDANDTRRRMDRAGLVYPGARIGHTDPIEPSQGGRRYEAFVAQNIRQSKGRWRRKPLSFYGEQSGFHHEVLRTHAGRRIYHEALYGVSRKNGKSTDAAAMALYFLTADDEPAPEVYGAAGARDQAKLILEEAKRMVRQSPKLSEWCKIYRNEIAVPSIDGVYRVVSADGGLSMGSNPSAVIGDEIHVWPGDAGRELFDALTTGMDARLDPIFIGITTAGYDRDSICYEIYERLLRGDDPEALLFWLGALENEPVDEYETWKRANPAPWLQREHWQRQLRRNPLPVFMRLHLNRWTESEHLWLKPGTWQACADRDAKIAIGERVWLGVDIGVRHDNSAVVEVALRRDPKTKKRRYIVKAYIFKPAETDGVLDLAPVENLIRELVSTRRVMEVRYDPHFFHRSAEDLSEIARMTDIPMSNARTVPMAQLTYDAIIDNELAYDPDDEHAAEFTKQVLSAAVRETERGWRWSKAKSQYHIDGLTALGLAMSGTSEARTVEPGARPAAPGSTSKANPAAVHARREALTKRAETAVYTGSVVECTTAEYRDVIRTALQNYAGRCVDADDGVRAVIALNEVKRLDAIHGSDI